MKRKVLLSASNYKTVGPHTSRKLRGCSELMDHIAVADLVLVCILPSVFSRMSRRRGCYFLPMEMTSKFSLQDVYLYLKQATTVPVLNDQ